MVQFFAVLGFLIGLLFKGRIRNISSHEIRWIPALVLSFLMEALVMFGLLYRIAGNSPVYNDIRVAAAIIQYILVLLFLIKNTLITKQSRGRLAFGFLAAGSLANGLAIIFNSGMMPVAQILWQLSPEAVNKINQAHHYALADGQTKLLILGDWIPVWSLGWYMVSPGDFLIAAGLFMFCFLLTRNGARQKIKRVEHHDEIVYTNGR